MANGSASPLKVCTVGRGLSVGKFGDGVAPALGVALFIARIGCLLFGCCFGAGCDAPWCVTWGPGSPVYDYHVESGLIAADDARSLPVQGKRRIGIREWALAATGVGAFILALLPVALAVAGSQWPSVIRSRSRRHVPLSPLLAEPSRS